MTEPTNDSLSGDRRIMRTRQTIIESLIKLVRRKAFQSITVRDITDLANVNRTTFYAHYTDKYDLLDSVMGEKLQLLKKELMESLAAGQSVDSAQPEVADGYYLSFFNHLAEQEPYYRIILEEPYAEKHYAAMQHVVRDSLYERILTFDPEQKLLIPLDLLLDYMSVSLMGLSRKWLEQQMIYTPRYMALQLTRLSAIGVYQAMGMPLKPSLTKRTPGV
ncbi:TetR/AcrR family transcriptional regulator [Paenibacillus sp. CAU 1782]